MNEFLEVDHYGYINAEDMQRLKQLVKKESKQVTAEIFHYYEEDVKQRMVDSGLYDSQEVQEGITVLEDGSAFGKGFRWSGAPTYEEFVGYVRNKK